MKIRLFLASIALVISSAANASPITINPTSDGSLYTCLGCNTVSDGAYVLTSGYIQGAVKFSTSALHGQIDSALLTLNPYGLPLWGPTVDVYGYGTNVGVLEAADANAGTFIGTLTLPQNLGFGQDAYFDVTAFLTTVHSPFVAFNLRSSGTDVFSSLEYNYGHPSQLIVTTRDVPEPATAALFVLGMLGLFMRRLKHSLQK